MFAQQLTNSNYLLAITLIWLTYLPITASEEQAPHDGMTYSDIQKIVVYDPHGEVHMQTHTDGSSNVYLRQEIVNNDDDEVSIENPYADGTLAVVVSYLTNPRTQRTVTGSPDVQGNVVEDVHTTGGGIIVGGGGRTHVSGNVIRNIGPDASGIVVGSGGGSVRGNVVCNIGPGAHGIVIGGQPEENHDQHDASQPHAKHTIVVPKGRAIAYYLLVTTAGLISTDGLTGELVTRNPNGHTTIAKHTGSVNARSTTGNINIQDYQSGARVTLRTTTGRIMSPFGQGNITNKQIGDGRHKVDANTVTGNITFTRSE